MTFKPVFFLASTILISASFAPASAEARVLLPALEEGSLVAPIARRGCGSRGGPGCRLPNGKCAGKGQAHMCSSSGRTERKGSSREPLDSTANPL